MAMYGGIDLHSNNLVLVPVDGDGQQVRVRKLATDLRAILEELLPFGEAIQGLAVNLTDTHSGCL
ncbi:hypothetical protein [Thiohalorhabdus sp.]|uniref:hypothetical protein n=1 Tax=Thiohalorhabdus sp. TaxID=3094134 RepID=UPI002FC36FAD